MQFPKIAVMFGIFIAVFLAEAGYPTQAVADIYSYTDEKGVTHFSNVPTSPQYRFKMREVHFDSRRLLSGNYDKLINDACVKHGVDPLLVKAIIKAESDFNPAAVSIDGAKGLMQLMPETADDMGVNDVYDPRSNIDGGVKYLKRLMDIFKSDLKLVVAAYNAGENAVLRYNSIPPFKETREYVKKVLKYLKDYKEAKGSGH